MTNLAWKQNRSPVSVFVLFLCAIAVVSVSGQIEWLEDASEAQIPAAPIRGRINGKSVTFPFGEIKKSGGVSLGTPDTQFVHYTIHLTDSQSIIDSRFSAQITVTVRKGELPDAKTFRANFATTPDKRSGLRGEFYWIPDLYGVRMSSRSGKDFISGDDLVSSEAEPKFTGRVELGRRKGKTLGARLFICYNDEQKSCLAGKIDLSVE